MSGECDDCGEHATDCRCNDQSALMTEWISVKDRLPGPMLDGPDRTKSSPEVLIYEAGTIWIGYLVQIPITDGDGEIVSWDTPIEWNSNGGSRHPSHWMPLPEPPNC